jgi:DNA topoisomerase-1
VRKGARPWDIGCPLCHHISSNRESLSEIPSLTPPLIGKLEALHIYTASDLAKSEPEWLATALDISAADAVRLKQDAEKEMVLLKKRSECRKFLRSHLTPRKGRSYAPILKALKEAGVSDISSLAHADAAVLRKAGISEQEAATVLEEARAVYTMQTFRQIGIPPASIRKYHAAGISSPGDFCTVHPLTLSRQSGISLETVYRHADLVCGYLNRPAPRKMTKLQLEKSRKELMAIPEMGGEMILPLLQAGVVDIPGLLAADPKTLSERTGLSQEKISRMQVAAQKIKDNEIIRI